MQGRCPPAELTASFPPALRSLSSRKAKYMSWQSMSPQGDWTSRERTGISSPKPPSHPHTVVPVGDPVHGGAAELGVSFHKKGGMWHTHLSCPGMCGCAGYVGMTQHHTLGCAPCHRVHWRLQVLARTQAELEYYWVTAGRSLNSRNQRE